MASAPPSVNAIVSAAGKKIPVLVSPEVVIAGAAALPAENVATPVALSVVNAPVLGVVAPTVPLMLIEAVPVKLVTVQEAGVPNAVALPEASKLIDLPAGYTTNTSLVPAEKLTADPELDDARMVSRDSVVPEEVYVPMPTSHSEVP